MSTAMSFDGRAVVEEFIQGAEVHIGIMGGRAMGGVQVKPHSGFYSFEAKYTSGKTDYIIPPEIDDGTYDKAMQAALGRTRH